MRFEGYCEGENKLFHWRSKVIVTYSFYIFILVCINKVNSFCLLTSNLFNFQAILIDNTKGYQKQGIQSNCMYCIVYIM